MRSFERLSLIKICCRALCRAIVMIYVWHEKVQQLRLTGSTSSRIIVLLKLTAPLLLRLAGAIRKSVRSRRPDPAVQVILVEPCDPHKFIRINDLHVAAAERERASETKLLEHAIDVNAGHAK
jgi:hypothetical protein